MRIGYCKATHLFVNFEVRTTDHYKLPYTARDLFQITQVCDKLFIKVMFHFIIRKWESRVYHYLSITNCNSNVLLLGRGFAFKNKRKKTKDLGAFQ